MLRPNRKLKNKKKAKILHEVFSLYIYINNNNYRCALQAKLQSLKLKITILFAYYRKSIA